MNTNAFVSTKSLLGKASSVVASVTLVVMPFVGLVPQTAFAATTVSFGASKDTYIDQNQPTTNFGSANDLDVKSADGHPSSNNKRALIAFNLSSIPAGSTITSATLKLYVNGAPADPRIHEVHRVTASWLEGAATWNTTPSFLGSVTATASITSSSNHTIVSWNVTSDVSAFVNGTTNNGWLIKDSSENANNTEEAIYASKDQSAKPVPELVVVYTPPVPTYTLTYDSNSATGGGTVPTDGSSPYTSGATVTVLGNTGSLVKTGFTFNGWNTAANGSGTSYAASATFSISGNTTLYAQWTPVPTYTVTFDSNGGTPTPSPITGVVSGNTVTLPAAPTQSGFTFNGWNTAANGSGSAFTASTPVTADVTVYAQWTAVVPDTFAVIYDGNSATGGTVPTDGSSPYTSGTTVTVLDNTGSLVKTGYTFGGWNTAADGSGTNYAAASTFSISSNTTLYAQWTPVPTYTLTYDSNSATGGTVPTDGSSPYTSGATVTVLGNTGSLVKTGFTFNGWNTAANGSGTSYAASATFSISGNTTLYAQWTPVPTYTVTFDSNGGTPTPSPITGVVSGNTVTLPAAPTQSGFTFNGWNTAANGSGSAFTASTPVTADVTVYAQWTAEETSTTYTLTYTAGANGSIIGTSPQTVVSGADGSAVTAVPNSGYHFVNWSDSSTANPRTDTHVTANIEVAASFAADETPTPPPPPSGGGNGPIFGSLGGQVLGVSIGPVTTGGQVLGASCGLFMNKHLKYGSSKNDKDQTGKLQTFLNKWMNAGLPVTGAYGPLTVAAVKNFQAKYSNEILAPWGITTPTGLVYLSTLRQLNLLECPQLSLQLPALVPWSQNPNAQ
jgi:uncharacterized repeat protein (TIGR02543 family)